ncbi:parB-like partition protein [Caldalkalibacillus thermarum TA2.A1]|uniref:ParB-like partition protein n=1 Tax=Caldalkalibacillus thermarum (strain TA2.A1) TaxID=986075 RepID=F5L4T1_CALTT|nr:ParB/RepB/Spo0J family partition protein [Caldalkalibacillus thermarum]EGL83648.1 parB-like partition protein [Caldalkalibacillus thermarum TA2.A1]QZT34286.1 ParB/RepB/Spo0J family partition protein [Caldalkalibacillus thermarum TA2.A1]
MSKRLGKGLDALLPSLEINDHDQVIQIKLSELRPNPYQPRKDFNEEALAELTQSIKEHGVIQPIIVRKSIKGYEIVAGERRFRASKEAGLETIPAVVKDFTESQVMEIALIENLQRENLNAMEVAYAYKKLMDKFNLTQDELAVKVGKSRPHVANFLRLLQLPDNVQEYVSRGTLSMGHARALLGCKDKKQISKLAKKCIDEQLSVRQLEQLIKQLNDVSRETKQKKSKTKPNPFIHQYEEQLKSKLGTSVKIKKGDKKGKIEIEFFSDEDLQRLVEMIG